MCVEFVPKCCPSGPRPHPEVLPPSRKDKAGYSKWGYSESVRIVRFEQQLLCLL